MVYPIMEFLLEIIMSNNVSTMRGESSKLVLREMCSELGLSGKTMVEIGSYAGESTVIFAEFCEKVYTIDPFLNGMPLSDGTTKGENLIMHPDVEQEFDKRINGIPNIVKMKGFDYDVISQFEDESLDFVYIDALHTEEEMNRQIKEWLPKIKPNGVLGGHDFCEHFAGIKRAVLKSIGKPDKIYNDDGNSWAKRKNSIMPLHFILTGNDFKYSYYLSIMTAIKVHNVYETILWMTDDVESEYLDLLKDKITIKKVSIPLFPALEDKPDYFIYAHSKDYLTYQVLYEYGGICLDLDTISVKNITDLLGDKELMIPSDAEKEGDFLYHYNTAISIGKKGSPLLAKAIDIAYGLLQRKEEFMWGMTAPILISGIVFENKELVFTPEFGVCGGYTGWTIEKFFREDLSISLDPKTRVVHLFAVASNKRDGSFDAISPEYIKYSTSLLARSVKNILTEKEWNTDKKVFVEIGANYFDTLVPLAQEGWKGIVVEAVPEYFDKIEKVDGIVYENVAISDVEGEAPFYYIPPDAIEKNKLPDWARGIGSLFNIHPDVATNKWERYLKSLMVKMITVKSLLDKHHVNHIDYLKIDTEGYDCAILEQFDISNIDEILFEHKHCKPEELKREFNRLKENSFVYKTEGDNVRAKKQKTTMPIVSANKFRFHLLSLVHLPQSREYMSCAFTQKNRKLAKMLTGLGHEVFFYGSEGSDVEEYCNSDSLHFVQTHTLAEIAETWGDGDNRFEIGYDWKNTDFRHDFSGTRTPLTMMVCERIIDHIDKVKKPDDFLLNSMGYYYRPIVDKANLYLSCESGIGYRGSMKGADTKFNFRAFESAFIRDFTYGSEHPFADLNGSNYDRVIPNYFEEEDFVYQEKKEDYYFFIGRMIQRKGIREAAEACKATGARLIIAGQGASVRSNGHLIPNTPPIDFDLEPSTWEYVGFVNVEQRKKWMAGAIATFTPTLYQEIFGGTHIESMLHGTPPITSNFGVFNGTIPDSINGKLAFRCNTLNDLVNAMEKAKTVDHAEVRKYAERYLMPVVAQDYQQWFEDLYHLYLSSTGLPNEGWYWLPNKEK